MNELKAGVLVTPHNEGMCFHRSSAVIAVTEGETEFYLKSEADKVIAELKQKINEAQTELELWRDGSIISEAHQKELDGKRHSDYKRCLAMARIAQDDWHLHNSFYAMGHQEFEKRKCDFYDKWHKRWLELAEEPTWARFLQMIRKEAK